EFFRSLTAIHIIDNGDGMHAETIKSNWMTIGTANKANAVTSRTGRPRSGEKGIGRFALDRLGESCSLLSTTKDQSVSWRVDWNDFDKTDKKINEVHAYLSIVSTKIHSRVQDVLTREQIDVIEKSMRDIKKSKDFRSFFKTGTHIEIN